MKGLTKLSFKVMQHFLSLLICISIALGMFAETALAQSQYGSIRGVVTDPSGAVISGGEVQAVNQKTNVGFKAATNEIGEYLVGGLIAGTYRVIITVPGFREFRANDVFLISGSLMRVDAKLQLGEASEVVNVEASAALLNTETPSIAQLAPRNYVESPATLQRNGWLASESIVPFLPGQSYGGGSSISAFGARSYDRKITVDGAQLSGPAGLRLPRLSVQEIEAVSLNASVEHQTSNTNNMTTVKGTNELHGWARLDIRNQALEARPYYASGPRPPGIPNTAEDFYVGGPVYIPKVYDGRNRTFFFFGFQREPGKTVGIQSRTYPTDAMKAGDLSALGVAIRDPLTGQPFPDNRIPSGRISPIAANLLSKFYPSVSTFGVNNGSESGIVGGILRDWNLRIDQKLGNNNSLNVSYIRNYNDNYQPVGFGGAGGPLTTGDQRNLSSNNFLSVNDAHVISPSLLNDFHFGVQSGPERELTMSMNGKQFAQSIGLPLKSDVPDITGGPTFSINGIQGVTFPAQNDSGTKVYTFRDNLSWHQGRHTLKMGFEHIRQQANNTTYGNVFGTYAFSGTFTGAGFADFLLGLPSTTSRTLPLGLTGVRFQQTGYYAEDDIRIRPDLNITLGLRFQNNRVPYEISGRFYNFDPATGNLVVPSQAALGLVNPGLSPALRSKIVTAQTAGFPDKLVDSQNGWNPRIGIAYRGFKDFVVRAGYGVYNHLSATGSTGNTNIFSAGAEDFTNGIANGAPLFDLSNPFPSGGTGGGTRPVGGLGVGGTNQNIKTPRTDQWNLSVDREIFWKFGLRTSYVGSKTTNATYRRNANLPPPSNLSFSPSRLNYPSYTSVVLADSGGNVSYHAWDIEARRPLAQGLYLNFGYTLSKQLTDVDEGGIQGSWGSIGALGPVIQNPHNRAAEKSNAHAIPRHRFKALYTWDFPLGKGRAWLNNPTTFGGGVLDKIVGGWTFTGIGYAHSGWWFTPLYSGFDSGNTGQFTTRPDRIGSGEAANRTPTNMFQVSDFVRQAAGRYGNSAPRIIEGLGAWKMDMGAYKSIPLTSYERGPELRIGMTSSNIFNHPNKAPWANSAWLINSPNTVGIADDYYYDSVVSGGLGAWRIVRFDVSVRF